MLSARQIRPVPDETTATATAEGECGTSCPRRARCSSAVSGSRAVSGRVVRRPSIRPPARSSPPVPDGDATDIDRAVGAARRAFANPSWRRMSTLDRGALLHRVADVIEAHADELALLESRDNGKPVSVARAVDVGTSVKLFRYFAGWPSKLEGSTIPRLAARRTAGAELHHPSAGRAWSG